MKIAILVFSVLLTAPAGMGAELVTAEGVHLVASVQAGHLAVYDGSRWQPRFWQGVNLGATTPGHFPGELSVSKEDYARWFPLIEAMNVRVLRVYTILPPGFYQALLEFNRTQVEPLWVLHGIWSPEEELIGDDSLGRNAWTPAITAQFTAEIADAVRAIHGDLVRATVPGHAGGTYTADISPYLLGWLVGTEWYPLTVDVTNQSAAGMPPYAGTYFRAKPAASPFESWLARMLDQVMTEDMRYRWQHPAAFVNWLSTDPLSHASEPNNLEDFVSVDPTHLEATDACKSGYFASYHVYPYYPDFLSYEVGYQAYHDTAGFLNPYAAYLHELRAYHKDLPLLVTEFGVPSSRGLAHYAPQGWNQGMHTEREQGDIVSSMIDSIYSEGYDGAIVFGWQEEWYKFTWNTVDLEIPFDRRPLWQNRLTNERFFGMLAMDAAATGSPVVLDGRATEWDSLAHKSQWQYPALDVSATHDEAYLYLMLRKHGGRWEFGRDQLYIGFSTLPGGSRTSSEAPGLTFNQPIQFLLRLRSNTDARLLVLSAYDQHTYRWGVELPMVPVRPEYSNPSLGIFLPWKLLVSRPLTIPGTGQQVPTQEIEVGTLRRGAADAAAGRLLHLRPALQAAGSDTLADWQSQGDTIEIRLPWMLLGFMDPSSLQVWDWPYRAGKLTPVPTDGVRIEAKLVTGGMEVPNQATPALYSWSSWELPAYRERLKESYFIVAETMSRYDARQPLPPSPGLLTLLPVVPASPSDGAQLTQFRSAAWRRAHPK